MKTGHIRITDRVYFEYYDLEKPEHDPVKYSDLGILTFKLRKAWEEYEASKQLVEVGGVFWGDLSEEWFFEEDVSNESVVKNNQPCRAEITTIMTPNMLEISKATILELC